MQNNDSNRPEEVKHVRKDETSNHDFIKEVGKGVVRNVLIWTIAGFITRRVAKLFRR